MRSMEPSDSKKSRVSSVFDPHQQVDVGGRADKDAINRIVEDYLPVDSGCPWQVAERYLPPDNRVGRRQKLIPQLCLRVK